MCGWALPPPLPLTGSLFCRAAENKRDMGKGREKSTSPQLPELRSQAWVLLQVLFPHVLAPAPIPVVTLPGRACAQVTSARSDGASPAAAGSVLLVPQRGRFHLPGSAPDGAAGVRARRLAAQGMLSGLPAVAGTFFSHSQPLQDVFYRAQNWSLKPLMSTGDSGAQCKQSILY